MPGLKGGRLKALGLGLLALAFTACGGDGPLPPTSYDYYIYVANGDDTVSAFALDPETGALTPGPLINLKTDMQPQSLAVTPSGKFAYVVGSYYNTVYAYSIDPVTGAWNGVPGTPFWPGVRPSRIAVDPTGRYVYVVSYDNGAVAALRINADSGALSLVPGSPFPAAGGPFEIAVEPEGKFAYVLNADTETVTAFAIDGATGALTSLGAPVAVGSDPQSLTVDPSGRHLYVPNLVSRDISAFDIDVGSGVLTPVPGSPFTAPQLWGFTQLPWEVAVEPSGRFAYVINMGSMTLSSYSIDAATGALTPSGYMVTVGDPPKAIAVGPTGRHAYIALEGAPGNVTVHEIDPATGEMSISTMLPTGNWPTALAIARVAR
jgi:6-phosphogluconolactonase (cycloisomerase 2 family)